MIVNKYHYLDSNYAPSDIVKISNWYAYDGHSTKQEVYDMYKNMWNAAKKEGLTLLVNSGYRTLSEQQKEYDLSGDNYASRPGFSEHQTGLALDIVTYDTVGNNFEDSDEFKWLENNAAEYGFILRYPKNKEDITGYSYESWHYRYVGVELAKKVKNSGLTYDEYYAYFCEYKNEC
jgi:D-alanyl-D-alanine carboxypeptidase